VGFPLGATTTNSKVYEAMEAIRNGAKEIDMVINVGALKSKDYSLVLEDIRKVVEVSAPNKVKVILETASLSHEEKISACVLAKAGGAAFVKTSTGFGPGGATVDDIALMRKIVGHDMEVKASGGIRSREDAVAMIDAGADRIGASASVAIVLGKKGAGAY
jgi:deoxyribose-phosphate aldolase